MNKSAIQRYAVWARTEMIAQVSQRAYQYGITPEGYGDFDAVSISGHLLSDSERKQRQGVIRQIQTKGYTQAMEEIAYTWFNRFIALRFMEVNNYLPSHIRVFTDSSGAFKPEILTQALHLDLPGLDMDKVAHLIEENQNEDLYRYLLLTQCNALNSALPRMFESLGSYTELLLPNNILRQDGVIGRMVSDIPEEDWTDQVQIIGWLYQYYNTELNEIVYDGNMSRDRISKDLLPAATTIYTPDWSVRYMVENSLGRLWLEGHPNSELRAKWKYYLDDAEQKPAVQVQLNGIRAEYMELQPKDIKLIDPCMGSGHILVYAFDVLIQIYKSVGYSERDAVQSILQNNLYGLDIDDRAAQLAYFAVMMKARQYDRRIFSRDLQPHVFAIEESNDFHVSAEWRLGTEKDIAIRLISEMQNAKEYGSILNLSLTAQELSALDRRIIEIKKNMACGNLLDDVEVGEIVTRISSLLEVASVLVKKYNVVVTNPPYLGNSRFSQKLDEYVKSNYPSEKNDLSMVMYKKALQGYCKHGGFVAFITTSSWMFLLSFEKIRSLITKSASIVSLVDYGTELFDGKVGHNPIVAWVTRNAHLDYNMCSVRLVDYCYSRRDEKEPEFFKSRNRYFAMQSSFSMIPGSPIAYWASDNFISAFAGNSLGDFVELVEGVHTRDNDRFLRLWFEIDYSKSALELFSKDKKWYGYNKGGLFRQWYGNNEYVVDWENDGERIKGFKKASIGKCGHFFEEGITFTFLTSSVNTFRFSPKGNLYDFAGPTMYPFDVDKTYYLLALFVSKVCYHYLKVINPTINMPIGDIKKLPVIYDLTKKDRINVLSLQNVALAKTDWDLFETSWDFKMHPIVELAEKSTRAGHKVNATIASIYAIIKADFEQRFKALKGNEEELNAIFIDIYGLQDELTPSIEDDAVTVRQADIGRDVRSLVSYAVGCMFGRYSLDTPGLAYAGGDWDSSKYSSFIPDTDNIIPICDDEYFEDDITGLFVKWVRVVFGEETLEENLKFIADALGGKGTPREVIRNYFLNGFYADHLKVYQKRPIYWLFDSGKKNGFKALIYIHRYRSDLLACMRTDYVHEQQERYRTQLRHIGDAMGSASASESVRLAKQQKKLQEQAIELQKYEEKIHHLADQNIKIDLDDGVVHNYEIFSEVLAKRK